MKITALIENTSCSSDIAHEHGLSLYIEACGKKLVFDTGLGSNFAVNAEKLGIDLSAVDFAVLSHGHFDHGGGLREFISINKTAPVYARKMAFDPHYSQRPDELFYNGIDMAFPETGRVIFTGREFNIGGGFSLFSEVPPYEPVFSSSRTQLEVIDGENVPDRFLHEQNLVINENGKYALIAGCAHSGIYNIITRFREIYHCDPGLIVGGFHLMIPNLGKSLPDEEIDELAAKLAAMKGTRFYTCHCTGKYAYERMHDIMGSQVKYLSAGESLEF